VRTLERGVRDAGPRGQVRAAIVPLGRDEGAAEHTLVEVGEAPPIAGNDVYVPEPRVDHDADLTA
jgi:hypothetical protein